MSWRDKEDWSIPVMDAAVENDAVARCVARVGVVGGLLLAISVAEGTFELARHLRCRARRLGECAGSVRAGRWRRRSSSEADKSARR